MLFEDMLTEHLKIAKQIQESNSKMFDEIDGKLSPTWKRLSEGDNVRIETIEKIINLYKFSKENTSEK